MLFESPLMTEYFYAAVCVTSEKLNSTEPKMKLKSEQGIWRIRSNQDIQNMYKSPDIVVEINVRRLELLGHVVRMEDNRLLKIVFNAKPEGRRGV
jgi:hypothetical protein